MEEEVAAPLSLDRDRVSLAASPDEDAAADDLARSLLDAAPAAES